MASNQLANEFCEWALDPARTNDELFTVELLMEGMLQAWRMKRKIYATPSFEQQRAHRRERAGNPLYRPTLSPEQFIQAAEGHDTVTHFWAHYQDDREMRDVQALRFFPNLKQINIHEAVLADLSPLRGLPKLEHLTLWEPGLRTARGMEDFSELGALEQLQELHLWLRAPWPDLKDLGRLRNLRVFHYRGNPLALGAIGALPALEKASLGVGIHWKTPLRSLRELPAMPELRLLDFGLTDDLVGIEAFPQLVNLSLEGTFVSLEPLAQLAEVTALTLTGEFFADLSPLARMPKLRELKLVREEPLALDVLTAAPALCQVTFERCPLMGPELAGLNAALTPWSDLFLLPEPMQPAAPLRFIQFAPQSEEAQEHFRLRGPKPEPPEFRHDPALLAAYRSWFDRETGQRLDALLGKKWRSSDLPGFCIFHREEDALCFREIAETLRAFILQCRYPQEIRLIFEPLKKSDVEANEEERQFLAAQQKRDPEADWLDRPFNAEREREQHQDFIQQRREEFQRRAREHRLRLQQEQGLKIDPAEFTTLPPPPPPAPQEPELEEEEPAPFTDSEQGGGDDLPHETFMPTLRKDFLWIPNHMRAQAEYYWGEPAEDWHALPGPLEDRPSPH